MRNPGRRQDAAQAPRARLSPPSQIQSPPVPQRCFVRRSFLATNSTTRKRKPSADCTTITAVGAYQRQLVPAPQHLPKVRKADK